MPELFDDLEVLIEGAGLGTLGTDLFFGSNADIPTGSGPYTQIIITGGTTGIRIHNKVDGDDISRPGFQVVVKANSYRTAETRALALYRLIAAVRNATINGTFYLDMRPTQSKPFDGGIDNVGKAQSKFNVLAMRQEP